MGQQQLLLLVLGIVIVGLSVVVGINAFGENQVKANADAIVNDAVRIASDIQAWALKPQAFGGAGGWSGTTVSPTTVDFGKIGWGASGATEYVNVNGTYTLSATSDCTSSVTIPSGGDVEIYINATNATTGNTVCVGVAGTGSDDIGTAIDYGI